jgi:dCMP deaminase
MSSVGLKVTKLTTYYRLCHTVAELSPDEQTKVGALLINQSTGSILCTSYNGFVRGAHDDKLPKTRPEKYEFIQHAEQNILTSALLNTVNVRDCTVVCTLSPCIRCVRMLYQAGISDIYFEAKYRDFESVVSASDLVIKVEELETGFHMTMQSQVG